MIEIDWTKWVPNGTEMMILETETGEKARVPKKLVDDYIKSLPTSGYNDARINLMEALKKARPDIDCAGFNTKDGIPQIHIPKGIEI